MKFNAEAGGGYIVFVPPNLDSGYWELEGTPSLTQGFYAAYTASKGTIYFRRLLEKWSMFRRASG